MQSNLKALVKGDSLPQQDARNILLGGKCM